MGVVKDVVTIAGTGIVVAGGVLWFLNKRRGGSGFGLSLFGGGGHEGGTELEGVEESGPLDEDGGDGGKGKEKAEDGTSKDGGAAGAGEGKNGSSGSGGKSQGTQQGSKKDGDGGTSKGGEGLGGGSGGGIGHGEGSGSSGGVDEVAGDGEVEEGGGDGGEMDPLHGWGDVMIEVDLPKPDTSSKKLEAVANTIYALVEQAVFATNLPGPLAKFNPELGSVLHYWADVALHSNYKLPPGRLDPENKTHVPWINLWLDIRHLVIRVENEVNG